MTLRSTVGPSTRSIAAVTFAAGFGGIIEYFDLFVATFAGALVWPRLFFPAGSPITGTALSLASVGVTFIIRPIGGFVFGHIGDRTGRRNTLVLTLVLLAVSMVGIGLLPAYAVIGAAAPIILFILRGLFGIGLGGEFGGAVSWIIEFAAKAKWRSFWSVWAAPANIGLTIAGLAFGYIASTGTLFTYGWRIPFIIGGLMIAIAFIMRYKLEESPLFKTVKERGEVVRAPAGEVFKKYWKRMLALAVLVGSLQAGITTTIVTPFSLIYLGLKGVPNDFTSYAVSIGNAIGIITFVAGPYFCEKLGRKRHLLIAIIWALIGAVIYFPMLNTLNRGLILLAITILEVQVGFNNSAIQAICGESFPTRYRYSGSGLSYQLGNGLFTGLILMFLTPTFLVLAHGVVPAAPYLVVYVVVYLVLALVALATLKETRDLSLEE